MVTRSALRIVDCGSIDIDAAFTILALLAM